MMIIREKLKNEKKRKTEEKKSYYFERLLKG